jgi:hypothetical protein
MKFLRLFTKRIYLENLSAVAENDLADDPNHDVSTSDTHKQTKQRGINKHQNPKKDHEKDPRSAT